MGFYDSLNTQLKSFDKTKGLTFDISKPFYTNSSPESEEIQEPILEIFDPNAGRDEAYSKYMRAGNFRNAKRATRYFDELWDNDLETRKTAWLNLQDAKRWELEAAQRKAKWDSDNAKWDKYNQELDALDYHNAGWRMNEDGTWRAPTADEQRWHNIAKQTMGGNNNMDNVIDFQNEMNRKYNAGLVVDGKLGRLTLKWWQSQHGGVPVLQKPKLVPRLTSKPTSKISSRNRNNISNSELPYVVNPEIMEHADRWLVPTVTGFWNSDKKLQEDIAMGQALRGNTYTGKDWENTFDSLKLSNFKNRVGSLDNLKNYTSLAFTPYYLHRTGKLSVDYNTLHNDPEYKAYEKYVLSKYKNNPYTGTMDRI